MQRSVQQEKRLEVPEQDYPYLLRWFREKHGEVRRTGNDFWVTQGEVGVVATLLSPTRLQLVGEDVFNPEIVEVSQLVKEARTRGKPVQVYEVLHICAKCQSFYVFPTAMNQHGPPDDIHKVKPLVEGSHTKYIPILPPFEQRRSPPMWYDDRNEDPKWWKWRINWGSLFNAFKKHLDQETAKEMADLLSVAYREGVRVSVQEMVQGARLPAIVYERHNARRDIIEARMVSPIYTKKTPPLLVQRAQSSRHITIQSFRTLCSTFIDWKVKVNGQVLTPEQLTEAAVRLGLPIGFGSRAAIRAAIDANDQIEESGKLPDYTQILDDAAKDGALADGDRLVRFAKRDRKLASAMRKEGYSPRCASYKEKPSWKDRAKSPKSPRYEVQKQRPQPVQPQRSQPSPTEDELKEAEAFLARFNPTEIIDFGRGLLKAKTTFNSHNIIAFNSVFYPQRPLEPREFPEEAVSLVKEIAKATGGRVVVSTQRKERSGISLASLEVVIDGKYTVRVATRDLSVKLENLPDPEKEKKDFMEKFSLKPADIVVGKDGFIKATKAVTTRFGSGTLEVFNTVFTPQRLPVEDEFGVEAKQVAEMISSKMGGSVVVTENVKRGTKHLDVIFGAKHTVRVATGPLSSPLSGGDN